ncbi:MAG: sugar transferase [Deltaproteobacteria bacterium]|nr:sugar transferase [Deltaproteobacteria bacterium]
MAEFEDKTQQIGRVMFLLDIGLTTLAFLLSYWLYSFFFSVTETDFFSHLALLPLILAFLIFFLSYFGAYKGPRVATLFSYTWAVTRGIVISIAILLTLLFLFKIQYVSRAIIVLFAGLNFVVLIGARIALIWYFRRAIQKGENFLKVLIIGTGDRAAGLSEALRQRSEWGIDIVGHLDPDPGRVGWDVCDSPVLGTVEDITSILKDHVIDEVILAIPRSIIKDVEDIAYACEEEGVKLRFMADVFDLQVARIRLVELGRIPLLTLEPVAQDEVKLLVKRVLDLILTLLAMPVLLPVMGVIAIAIKFDSPGSVLFVQERVGLKKRLFPMFKFRSMVQDAEEKMRELEELNEAEGPIFKIVDDPRMTRVGKFIRKTSLDEFPQFFNVLRGEMSLVGPRPMSIRDVDLFDKGIQRKRFSVKPGLTCLWQISGRSDLPFTKWLELDLTYIENWSLGLDFKILFKTIPAVLKGGGAA